MLELEEEDERPKTPRTRPWLALYGNFLRTAREREREGGEEESEGDEIWEETTLIPDGALFQVLKRLTARQLARVSCVCRSWRRVASSGALWEELARDQFGNEAALSLGRRFAWRWQKAFLCSPRLRTDGAFVSVNSYYKYGSAQVAYYFRYLRILDPSTCLYKTSPRSPEKVLPQLHASRKAKKERHVFPGRIDRRGRRVHITVKYPSWGSGEATFFHIFAHLRGTCPGAFNRLAVELMCSVIERDAPADPEALELLKEWDPGEGAHVHLRGIGTYVFVPWDESSSSLLNSYPPPSLA